MILTMHGCSDIPHWLGTSLESASQCMPSIVKSLIVFLADELQVYEDKSRHFCRSAIPGIVTKISSEIWYHLVQWNGHNMWLNGVNRKYAISTLKLTIVYNKGM